MSVLSVILSQNHSRSFFLSWNLLFWPWKWKYRSFASSVLILLNLFSKSMILTKYFCAKLQYFRIFKLIWESFYWLMSVLLRISVSWKNGIFRTISERSHFWTEIRYEFLPQNDAHTVLIFSLKIMSIRSKTFLRFLFPKITLTEFSVFQYSQIAP